MEPYATRREKISFWLSQPLMDQKRRLRGAMFGF